MEMEEGKEASCLDGFGDAGQVGVEEASGVTG